MRFAIILFATILSAQSFASNDPADRNAEVFRCKNSNSTLWTYVEKDYRTDLNGDLVPVLYSHGRFESIQGQGEWIRTELLDMSIDKKDYIFSGNDYLLTVSTNDVDGRIECGSNEKTAACSGQVRMPLQDGTVVESVISCYSTFPW